MSLRFTYESLPGRVLFGRGAAKERLPAEIDALGATRILVFATERARSLAECIAKPFADRVAGVFADVRPHVPVQVAEQAREQAAEQRADALLSIGGGSTIGTAKIVALTTGLPIVAVPTTLAGSEMTPVWGMTTAARKETGRSIVVLPTVVVYDPALVETLPRRLAGASALNGMAHCVEALWTPTANPVTTIMALQGARALAAGIRSEGEDPAGDLLYGAYLSGAAFAVTGSGLHHKICHALGGAFDLPHAETHAVVLPHVLAFNASSPELRDVMTRLATALGADDPVSGLAALRREVGSPETLAALGLTPAQLEEAVGVVSTLLPVHNVRDVTTDGVRTILNSAYEGRVP